MGAIQGEGKLTNTSGINTGTSVVELSEERSNLIKNSGQENISKVIHSLAVE